MEYWDLYQRNGQFVRTGHPSNSPLPEGLYHLVINVLIQHQNGLILIVKRSEDKKIFPGKWEATVSGRVQQSEDHLSGAQRELNEELGLTLTNLQQIDTHIDDRYQIIISNYYVEVDIEMDGLTLQNEEIVAYRWITVEEFYDLLEKETIIEYSGRDFGQYPL